MDFLRTLKKRKPKQRVAVGVSTASPAGVGQSKGARGGAEKLRKARAK